MKPSDSAIDRFRDTFIIGPNLDNCVEDFVIGVGMKINPNTNQEQVDAYFGAFIIGMMTIMNPGSAFNRKYVAGTL